MPSKTTVKARVSTRRSPASLRVSALSAEQVPLLDTAELAVPARPVHPSDAQRAFAALEGSLAQIAKPIGASRSSVDEWRKGASVPEDRYRRAIATHYGIPYAAWGDGGEPDAELDEADDGRSGDPLDEYRRAIRYVRRQLKSGALTARERAQLNDSYLRSVEKMLKLEQARAMLEDRTIREHVKWKRLKAEIIAALLPHPAAARDVEAAISRVLSDETDETAD